MGKHTVFVYGTLLSGCGNHRILREGGARFLGKDTVTGDMYGAGVPFVDTSGSGTIYGELYSVDDETLRRLDGLEGYDHRRPGRGLYNRIKVRTHGGVETFIYDAGNPGRLGHMKKIESGDYRKHRKSMEEFF